MSFEVRHESRLHHVHADPVAAHLRGDGRVQRDAAVLCEWLLAGLDIDAPVGRLQKRELAGGLEVVALVVDGEHVGVTV